MHTFGKSNNLFVLSTKGWWLIIDVELRDMLSLNYCIFHEEMITAKNNLRGECAQIKAQQNQLYHKLGFYQYFLSDVWICKANFVLR